MKLYNVTINEAGILHSLLMTELDYQCAREKWHTWTRAGQEASVGFRPDGPIDKPEGDILKVSGVEDNVMQTPVEVDLLYAQVHSITGTPAYEVDESNGEDAN